MEKTILEEKKEAVDLKTRFVYNDKKDNIWIEECSEISGDNLYWLLLDVIDKTGSELLYVKRVDDHLEVGVVNKIEIIE